MRLRWRLQWRPVPHLSPQPGQAHRRVLQSTHGCACCPGGDVRHLTVLPWQGDPLSLGPCKVLYPMAGSLPVTS